MSTQLTTLVLMPLPRPSICSANTAGWGLQARGGSANLACIAWGAEHEGMQRLACSRPERAYPCLQLGHLVPVERIARVLAACRSVEAVCSSMTKLISGLCTSQGMLPASNARKGGAEPYQC